MWCKLNLCIYTLFNYIQNNSAINNCNIAISYFLSIFLTTMNPYSHHNQRLSDEPTKF